MDLDPPGGNVPGGNVPGGLMPGGFVPGGVVGVAVASMGGELVGAASTGGSVPPNPAGKMTESTTWMTPLVAEISASTICGRCV
jgi:hypothetical protein